MDYAKATDLMIEIVTRIVNVNHKRLDGASIAVITREKAGKTGGKIKMADASLVGAKMKPLLDEDYDFIITIAEDVWGKMTPEQHDALVDHELCHCIYDDEAKPSLRPHDLEEFAEIIERWGFWRKDHGEQQVQGALLSAGIKVGTLK